MEFGRVPETALNKIDFTLPTEPAGNAAILMNASKASMPPSVYVGCAKWGRKEWVGKIYPKGTKEAAFLDHYVQHYNSIELNATHYKIYPPDAIRKWAARAEGHDFRFCPKLPKLISHYHSFINVDQQTSAFFEGIMAFGEHLGPIFIQVSETYSPERAVDLINYLRSLPIDLRFFLEVRHPKWLSDKKISSTLWLRLKELRIGAVITDTAGRRDCAHMHLTVPRAFVRFVGNSLHATDYARIDEWVDRIAYWLKNGLQELYFFMHMHDEAYSPELTIYLVDRLNEKCGLGLKRPRFV